MIEKLDIKNGGVEDLLNCIKKINEIIDWIDDVSALHITNKQVTANLPNIDAGELAYLQKENSNLKDEVEKLQKQLERAKSHLSCIKNNYNSWTPDRDDQMRAHAANCLAEIKELEDGNM